MKKVLFICTGNTCRSPMCEAYFKTLGGEVEAASAGIYACDGEAAAEHAAEVVAEFGGDLSGFHSRKLTPAMLAGADKVVVMSRGHLAHILELMPEIESKTVLLLEDRDVDDPFGKRLAAYRRCFEEMKTALDKIHNTLT